MERYGRRCDNGPQGDQVDRANQRWPAIGQHRPPILQPPHQLPGYETAGSRRAGRLRLEDRGWFAARRQWRHRLPRRPEPDLPTLILALRRLRSVQDQGLREPEGLWSEPYEQALLRLAVPERAALRQSRPWPGGLSELGP